MGITLYFGNVSKRKNSTFQPTLTESVECVLKDGTSENNPVFLISSNSFSANYCKWGNRYYFIDDIVFERNNLYSVKCVLDSLATYKSAIQNTSAFVAYDTSSNTQIIDNRLSIETDKTITSNSSSFTKLGQGSCVVLNVVGKDNAACVVLSEGQAQMLMSQIQTWMDGVNGLPYPNVSSITDVAEMLGVGIENLIRAARQFIATGKASDCIKNAILLPLPRNAISTVLGSTLYLGEYNTTLPTAIISAGTTITDDISLNYPWVSGIDDWRRNAPYTRMYLNIPYAGLIEIPTSEIIDDVSMSVLTTISPTSGDVVFTITSGTRTIMQMATNVASPYAIGASNVTPARAATAITTGVAGAAAAVATGGLSAVLAGTAGIVGVTNNSAPMPTSTGINAGSAILGLPATASLYCVFHNTNVTPNSVSNVIGTPTMAVKSLGNLSGYVETRNASVSAVAESVILEQINNFLNNGIYIE